MPFAPDRRCMRACMWRHIIERLLSWQERAVGHGIEGRGRRRRCARTTHVYPSVGDIRTSVFEYQFPVTLSVRRLEEYTTQYVHGYMHQGRSYVVHCGCICTPPKNPKNSDQSQISTIYASPKFCSYAPTRDVHPLIFCSSFTTDMHALPHTRACWQGSSAILVLRTYVRTPLGTAGAAASI